MKKIILFFFVLNSYFSFSQKTDYTLDPKGKLGDFQTLCKQYPDNVIEYRIVKDSGKVYQITAPKYSTYKVDYTIIKSKISQITNKVYSDSTIFVFTYCYKNDSTFLNENNELKPQSNLKSFIKEMKKSIEKKYPNAVSFLLFENGVKFSKYNEEPKKKEVFYSDKDGFFKDSLFKKSILCGSHCIIKPNGELVVRNGEYRLDNMADHLKPENWNKLFPKKE
jgi:hypothetical protein